MSSFDESMSARGSALCGTAPGSVNIAVEHHKQELDVALFMTQGLKPILATVRIIPHRRLFSTFSV